MRRTPRVGDIPHRFAAERYGAPPRRRPERVCRRDALPQGHREPAGRDVARTHPAARLAGGCRRRVASRTPAAETPSPEELSNAPLRRRRLRLPRRARPVVAATGRPGPAAQRLAAAGDRPADEQLLRVDRTAHPSPRPGPRPRRGAGPSPAGRSRRAQCPALHAGDQRRGQPGLAVVPAAGLHRRHPQLSLRRRPAGVRDPGPRAALDADVAGSVHRTARSSPRTPGLAR